MGYGLKRLPAMGIVKLPRVCELSFHNKSDEVASNEGWGVKGLDLWDVLPRVCGGHVALTVQPAIRVQLQPI
jgi:hypothetical protein